MTVRVYPWNSFDDPHREATIKLSEVALVDGENLPIPLTDQESWSVCVKLYAGTKVVPLKAIDDCVISRGEINQTIYRRFITSDFGQARLVKGVEVGRFHMNPSLSQGEREWLDEARFLREHKARPIVDERRIATQRITGMDERLRIVAAIVPDQHAYFADSTNAIHLRKGSPYALEYVLGLLNSTLFQWRFKLTSTNNNVGTNELEAMPFRVIDFSDPGDRDFHERVVGVVRRMMELEKKLQAARIGGERQGLLRRIRNAERRLDTLAYEMFGLADEDVAVIEHKADGV